MNREAKRNLLAWCKRATDGYEGVELRNFNTCWADGLAFAALVSSLAGSRSLNYRSLLERGDPYHTLKTAFAVADRKLGICQLLDPEDLLEDERPDDMIILTYLLEFYKKYRSRAAESVRDMVKRIPKSVRGAPPVGLGSPRQRGAGGGGNADVAAFADQMIASAAKSNGSASQDKLARKLAEARAWEMKRHASSGGGSGATATATATGSATASAPRSASGSGQSTSSSPSKVTRTGAGTGTASKPAPATQTTQTASKPVSGSSQRNPSKAPSQSSKVSQRQREAEQRQARAAQALAQREKDRVRAQAAEAKRREASRIRAEAEATKRKQEAEARRQAAEKKRKAAEAAAAKRRREAEGRRQAAERKRRAAEQEASRRRKAAADAARRKREAEAAAKRKRAAQARAQEDAKRRAKADAARIQRESEALEAKRIRQLVEAQEKAEQVAVTERLRLEEEEEDRELAELAAAEAEAERRRIEQDAEVKRLEDLAAAEEAKTQKAEVEAQRLAAVVAAEEDERLRAEADIERLAQVAIAEEAERMRLEAEVAAILAADEAAARREYERESARLRSQQFADDVKNPSAPSYVETEGEIEIPPEPAVFDIPADDLGDDDDFGEELCLTGPYFFRLEEELRLNEEKQIEEAREPRFRDVMAAYRFSSNLEKVIFDLEAFIEDNPHHLRAVLELGKFYHQRGQNRMAISLLKKHVDYSPGSEDEAVQQRQVRVALAGVYLNVFEEFKSIFLVQARKFFNRNDRIIRKSYPKWKKSALIPFERIYDDLTRRELLPIDRPLTELLTKKGANLEEAMKHFQVAMGHDPDNPLVLFGLAKIYDELGLYEASHPQWKDLTERFPSVEYLEGRLNSLYIAGLIQPHLELLREEETKNSHSPLVYRELSILPDVSRRVRKMYQKKLAFFEWLPSYCENVAFSEENFGTFQKLSRRVSIKTLKGFMRKKSRTVVEFMVAYIANLVKKPFARGKKTSIERNLSHVFNYFFCTLDDHITWLLFKLLETPNIGTQHPFVVRQIFRILLQMKNQDVVRKCLFQTLITMLPNDEARLCLAQAIVALQEEAGLYWMEQAIHHSGNSFLRRQAVLGLALLCRLFSPPPPPGTDPTPDAHLIRVLKLFKVILGDRRENEMMQMYSHAGLSILEPSGRRRHIGHVVAALSDLPQTLFDIDVLIFLNETVEDTEVGRLSMVDYEVRSHSRIRRVLERIRKQQLRFFYERPIL